MVVCVFSHISLRLMSGETGIRYPNVWLTPKKRKPEVQVFCDKSMIIPASQGQKRKLKFLELELQMVVRLQLGAEKQTWVPKKSNTHS